MASGNVQSMTFATAERAAVEGEFRVMSCELATDGAIWPCGLLLIKTSATGKWAPLATLPATGPYVLGVLDREVNTAEAGSGLVARLGAVMLEKLKVGVSAKAAPGTDFLFALETQGIFAM